jgi:hypothetical protein
MIARSLDCNGFTGKELEGSHPAEQIGTVLAYPKRASTPTGQGG